MQKTVSQWPAPAAFRSGQWVLGVLALHTVAILLTWAALPLLLPDGLSQQAGTDPLHLPGKDFKAVVAARSRQAGDSIEVLDMQPARRNGVQIGEAVFRTEPGLAASRFSQMHLRLDGWQSGQKLFLFWRSSNAPDQQRYQELSHDTDGQSWHTLSSTDLWEGDILELAIGVFGQPGPAPLVLHEVALHPGSRSAVFNRLTWEWSRFTPWTQLSANVYRGALRAAVLQPVTVASLWAVVALLIVFIGAVVLRRSVRAPARSIVIAGLASILLPWLAVDLLWQVQLERQLTLTQEHYGGLTQTQKHHREADASLQKYAARVRDRLERVHKRPEPMHDRPEPMLNSRLFLLNDADSGHSYRRLRMQFHLLPVNIYNFGKQLLPPDRMRPGDHVLLLQPATAVRFDPARGVLEDSRQRYRATLLDEHAEGRLFRLGTPVSRQEERR